MLEKCLKETDLYAFQFAVFGGYSFNISINQQVHKQQPHKNVRKGIFFKYISSVQIYALSEKTLKVAVAGKTPARTFPQAAPSLEHRDRGRVKEFPFVCCLTQLEWELKRELG